MVRLVAICEKERFSPPFSEIVLVAVVGFVLVFFLFLGEREEVPRIDEDFVEVGFLAVLRSEEIYFGDAVFELVEVGEVGFSVVAYEDEDLWEVHAEQCDLPCMVDDVLAQPPAFGLADCLLAGVILLGHC